MILPQVLPPKLVSLAWPRPTSLILFLFSASGLKIPEEEFGEAAYQAACDSATTERLLRTTPPAVSSRRRAGRPPLSVHNHLLSLLSSEGLQNCDNAACWAFSVHTKEKARRPRLKDKLNKNLKGWLAFLLTHTEPVLGLVSPASHGFQAVSSQQAICPSRNSMVSVQSGHGGTSIVI